jgi:hypothetical protein
VQDNSLLVIGLVGFAIMFFAVGALIYFYGWRFLTFGLIGGTISKLLGSSRDDTQASEEQIAVVPPRLDAQTAIQQLPDFHATVAQYRNQEKLTTGQAPEVDDVESDVIFTVDPGPNYEKDHYGVRYSGPTDDPGRIMRDRRFERNRGPDSGHDPEVHDGMFESDDT